MTWEDLVAGAKARGLELLGGFHPVTEDGVPGQPGTLMMLGPDPDGFWPIFTASSEARDGAMHPVDRWSARVIGDWATDMGGAALFPFGGPPYLPFFSWALATGRVRASPIRLMVHDRLGLMVSFRGALALPGRIDLPPAPPSPCLSCVDQPCTSTCPVAAFDGEGYDVPACKDHLHRPEGQPCLTGGCLARRACPVSVAAPRPAEQSELHMRSFLG